MIYLENRINYIKSNLIYLKKLLKTKTRTTIDTSDIYLKQRVNEEIINLAEVENKLIKYNYAHSNKY